MTTGANAGVAVPQPRVKQSGLVLTSLFIFVLTASASIYFAQSMSGGMRMPGGWTMSHMWMPMSANAWVAAVQFAAMWIAMMVAMMLPSSLPMLLLYRRAMAFRRESRLGFYTWLLGGSYFFVWTLFGLGAYLIGTGIARAAMRSMTVSRSIPLATGVALIVAGIYQLTPVKSACLRHCRDPILLVATHLDSGARGALRLGLHQGAFCAACCWALMLIQLSLGVMNLAVMAVVAAAIALEKLLPRGEWIARLNGVAALLGGIALCVNLR